MYGCTLPSLESGYFVFKGIVQSIRVKSDTEGRIPDSYCPVFGTHHAPLRYPSLPESGGKDKTMKMNMMGQNVAGSNVAGHGFMPGAVAINGGVGVMEMRRPQVNMDLLPSVDDVVNSVVAVAAEIAENAHITLRELKTKIDAVTEKKLPQYKQLMEQNPVAVAQTSVNGATITAYQNGYAVYEMDGARSVMAVDRCGDYRYDFNDGTYQVVPAEVFEEAEWSLRLIMEGERRLEHNLNKTSSKYEAAVLECDGSDWSDSVMVDFLAEDNAEMLADEELRRLYAAMGKLTDRQKEVIELYYFKGMTQQEIAEELGIRQQSVNDFMRQAIKKLKKVF